jgi:hypothetical protein
MTRRRFMLRFLRGSGRKVKSVGIGFKLQTLILKHFQAGRRFQTLTMELSRRIGYDT